MNRSNCLRGFPMLRLVMAVTLSALLFGAATAHAQWPQWGGPNRDFTVDVTGLADKWPDDGPPKLWHRELGDGYAAISVDDGVLYTMYRKESTDEVEYTVALDAKSGATLWEQEARSLITRDMARFGPGPHVAPLIVGDRVITVGANSILKCFAKKSGKVLWKRNLLEEYSLEPSVYGHGSSPLAYKDTVILPVTGPGESVRHVLAVNPANGKSVWQSPIYRDEARLGEYSSLMIVTLSGKDHLVLLTNERIEGRDPDTGKLRWNHPCPCGTGVNVSTPVFNGKDLLFVSAAYDQGSRVFRLGTKDGGIVPEELWFSRKMRIHHANPIIIGDYVYGSSGDFGAAFFMAMNMNTGQRAWIHRGLAKATCLYADGKFIILDEEGQLVLATATPKGLTIHSQCKITDQLAWTSPTLVDKTLYVRDRKYIMALDLGL